MTVPRMTVPPAAPLSWWTVDVYGYMPVYVLARSKAQARWRAFLVFCRDVPGTTFGGFIHKGISARPATDFEVQALVEVPAP